MQRLWQLTMISLLTFSCALLVAPAGMASQQGSSNQATLTLKQVKQRLKQNKQYLKDARKRVKAGDTAGLDTALNNYDRSMEGLNTALSHGQFQGSPSQQEDAYKRVQKATSKHLDVLKNLLSKVPSQAVPHIKHAMEVSQKGQETALNHLSQLQSQQAMRQSNQPGFEHGPRVGRSGEVGRPGSMGGPGNQPMGGPGAGPMGHPGGGPPMGGGHRGP